MHAATRPLEPREVARLLGSMRAAIVGELQQLPDEILAWHPARGEWCVKECLGHILEADRRAFGDRIRLLQQTPNPTFVEWNQEVVAVERHDCERPAADLVTEFSVLRAENVALVEALTTADLERGGTHPHVGQLRIRDLLHEWVHHDRNHFRQMLANVQAYVWPSMANTQRFSAELALLPEALPANQL